jgi:hypothetical protein
MAPQGTYAIGCHGAADFAQKIMLRGLWLARVSSSVKISGLKFWFQGASMAHVPHGTSVFGRGRDPEIC